MAIKFFKFEESALKKILSKLTYNENNPAYFMPIIKEQTAKFKCSMTQMAKPQPQWKQSKNGKCVMLSEINQAEWLSEEVEQPLSQIIRDIV